MKKSLETNCSRGLIINHHAPHLGASPDRKVVDLTADPVHGLLEIKCPNKDSFKDCSCLKNAAGNYTLKKTHEYYYQIVGQMGISGFTWCDFFVKCKNYYHLERIYFNRDEWRSWSVSLIFSFSTVTYLFCATRVCKWKQNHKLPFAVDWIKGIDHTKM